MNPRGTYETAYRKLMQDRIQELELALTALLRQTVAVFTPEGASERQIKAEISRAQNVLSRARRVYRTGDV